MQLHLQFPLPTTDGSDPHYSGTDSAELFVQNCGCQPQSWPWRDQPVRYQRNSDGYRAPEFDLVLWTQSVVLVGCSWAYGVGLDESQTIHHCLSERLAVPVINVSQGGTSIRWSCDQLTLLLAAGHRPRAVMAIWTDTARWPYYGAEGPDQPYRADQLWRAHALDELHCLRRAQLDVESVRVALRALDIPLVEATWSAHTAQVLAVTQLTQWDLARDQSHPGPLSASAAAQILTELYLD